MVRGMARTTRHSGVCEQCGNPARRAMVLCQWCTAWNDERAEFDLLKNHDAPACNACQDTGRMRDPCSADEDGAFDLTACTQCEGDMENYDQWKTAAPEPSDRDLDAERDAADRPITNVRCTHCDGGGNCIRESDDCDPRTGRYGVDVTRCRYCDEGEPYPCDEDGEPVHEADLL